MIEVKIPDFLKHRPTKEDCQLSKLARQYEERFGKTWATEGLYLKEGELEQLLEQCLRENRTFYDVIGIDFSIIDEDEDI